MKELTLQQAEKINGGVVITVSLALIFGINYLLGRQFRNLFITSQ